MEAIRNFDNTQYTSEEWDEIVNKLNETLVHDDEEYNTIALLGAILKDHIDNHPAGGGVESFVTHHQFQFRTNTAGVNNWAGMNVADNEFESMLYFNGAGTTLVGLVSNSPVPFFVAPKACKLKNVMMRVLNAIGGIVSIGIIKMQRVNGDAFYQNTGTNQAILLEQALNGGAATVNQRQYVDNFTGGAIADITINAGEAVILFVKSSITSASTVECILTAQFEAI